MKSVEQVLKDQLGMLMFEVAILTSQKSVLEDQIKAQAVKLAEIESKQVS
jgi:hypothetical protein